MSVEGHCIGGPYNGDYLKCYATRKEVFDPPLKDATDRDERRRALAANQLAGVYNWSSEKGWIWAPIKQEDH